MITINTYRNLGINFGVTFNFYKSVIGIDFEYIGIKQKYKIAYQLR